MPVGLKRAREKASLLDGVRVLVDAEWPVGLSKRKLRVDHWLRELGPSETLRQWFRQSKAYPALRKRYLQQLEQPEALAAYEQLHRLAHGSKQLTLVYSARAGAVHPAHVLRELLEGRKPPSTSGPGGAAAAAGRIRATGRSRSRR